MGERKEQERETEREYFSKVSRCTLIPTNYNDVTGPAYNTPQFKIIIRITGTYGLVEVHRKPHVHTVSY